MGDIRSGILGSSVTIERLGQGPEALPEVQWSLTIGTGGRLSLSVFGRFACASGVIRLKPSSDRRDEKSVFTKAWSTVQAGNPVHGEVCTIYLDRRPDILTLIT